jgi:hypothetical protein
MTAKNLLSSFVTPDQKDDLQPSSKHSMALTLVSKDTLTCPRIIRSFHLFN